MTPFEFGCRVKIAVETGGFGEYLGQGFDRGVQGFNKLTGMDSFSNPGAWTGQIQNAGQQTGAAAGRVARSLTPPATGRTDGYKDPSEMPGVSDEESDPWGTSTPAAPPPPPPVRRAPRPATPRPAASAPAPQPAPPRRPPVAAPRPLPPQLLPGAPAAQPTQAQRPAASTRRPPPVTTPTIPPAVTPKPVDSKLQMQQDEQFQRDSRVFGVGKATERYGRRQSNDRLVAPQTPSAAASPAATAATNSVSPPPMSLPDPNSAGSAAARLAQLRVQQAQQDAAAVRAASGVPNKGGLNGAGGTWTGRVGGQQPAQGTYNKPQTTTLPPSINKMLLGNPTGAANQINAPEVPKPAAPGLPKLPKSTVL